MNENTGLSSKNRNFIVAFLVLMLLIFGPVEPYGMVIRIAYLVVLPALAWYALSHFGSSWEIGEKENDRLNSMLMGIVAGIFFLSAYYFYTETSHSVCTGGIRDEGEYECTGAYEMKSGPDIANAFIAIIMGTFVVWLAVLDINNKPDKQ